MHPSILGLLAIDRLHDREREAAEARLAALATTDDDLDRPAPPRPPLLRHALALSAAALSRASRDVALRLDERVAPDLSRSSLP